MNSTLSTVVQVLKPPLDLLADVGKLNPGFTSIAVMLPILAAAMAAALSYFDNDPATAFLIGVVAAAFLILLLVVSAIAKGIPDLTATIVWFVRFVLMMFALVLAVLFTSVVFAWPREPHCIFTVKRDAACAAVGAVTAPSTTAPSAGAAPPPQAQWEDYRVFPHYLGTDLTKVDALRRTLVGRGWSVQRPEDMEGKLRGSWNEIRVNAEMDRAAAERLANDVSTGLDGRPIRIRIHPRVRVDRPEIWISN
ncbi:hypothetical protein C6569_20845 [Phreatobacter cathodiphilus]|uniref:Uncharacterized protein n=2 Tax=Phreatobacter cathodiphilus TaxID=1868589 RepID=A0A2S0NGJ2_9HYPH|nr:hypothetical protein C6569_20845 [Phreatobacter cathodiphilus]